MPDSCCSRDPVLSSWVLLPWLWGGDWCHPLHVLDEEAEIQSSSGEPGFRPRLSRGQPLDVSHSCFLWSHTGSCTHPSLGRPQGWLSRCRASAIWGLETTAEPSMSSNCCSISLRCSWNTTSKSPSSLLGCICREGDGWAYQVRPFVAPASTTGKLQPQCLSISVFPGCGGIPILQMGRLTTSRASEAFV